MKKGLTAKENIKDLLFDDGLLQMFNDYGYDHIPLEKGAEQIDVSIRCFVLYEFEQEVEFYLDELKGE